MLLFAGSLGTLVDSLPGSCQFAGLSLVDENTFFEDLKTGLVLCKVVERTDAEAKLVSFFCVQSRVQAGAWCGLDHERDLPQAPDAWLTLQKSGKARQEQRPSESQVQLAWLTSCLPQRTQYCKSLYLLHI